MDFANTFFVLSIAGCFGLLVVWVIIKGNNDE